MDSPTVYQELKPLLEDRVYLNEPMSKHTTWRIGGPAEIFVEPLGIPELARVFSFAHQKGIPVSVVGKGSNLLVSDKGISGIVVKIGRGLSRLEVNGQTLTVQAGAALSRLASAARDNGIGGFEFAAGIPGTVGGAVVMNAGANGSSMSDVVLEVDVMDLQGQIQRYAAQEMNFSYRSSALQGSSLVVVEAICRGVHKKPEEIQAEMEKYLAKRKNSQPLNYPNAGSVFKNPPGDSAGRLVEQAGCKGMIVGNAQVSLLHANFIVNLGGATARDVFTLIKLIQEEVYKKFSVKLETEVKLLGDH